MSRGQHDSRDGSRGLDGDQLESKRRVHWPDEHGRAARGRSGDVSPLQARLALAIAILATTVMAMSLVPPDWLVSRSALVPSWPALSFALLALFFVTRPGPWLPRLLAGLLAVPVALLASTELILRALAVSLT